MRRNIRRTAADRVAAIAIAAVVASGSAFLASPSVSMGDTGTADKVYWSDRQAPFMYGTDEAAIHAGDRFDVKDSRYRVQARDFEDGDVTSDIRVVSNGVNPDIPGDYTVSYSVTDSDGNIATMDTTVHVLAADSTDGDWYVKRVYQNPNTWNTRELLRMNRGDYMDRQMIGVHVPSGKSIDVSFLNSPSTLAMTVDCPTNDSKTDGTRTSISSGKTVTLKASDSIDTIPMIKTPMLPRGEGTRQQDIRVKVEYSDDDGIGAVHFWTDGDDEKAFIDSWSADGTHPFAYIETRAFEGMPTWSDLSTIKRLGTMNGWAASLTAWSDYWVKVMDKYDSMLGVSIRADNPLDQRVRTKYFCRANVHGFGGAYYNGGDHVGIHNANMWSIFEYNWGGLHEVGHGYQGFMSVGNMYLAEVSNNIYGYQVQHDKSIYKANGEWMNFDAQETSQNAKRLNGEFKTFDDVGSVGKLYVIMNVFKSITPDNLEKSHAEFFTWARKKAQASGTTQNVDMLCRWLAEEHRIDAAPYFMAWGVTLPDSTLSYLDSDGTLDRALIAGDALTSDAARSAYRSDNADSPLYALIPSSTAARYAEGRAVVSVEGSDTVKTRLEGRLAALVGGDGTSERIIATAPIHGGKVAFENVKAGNWRLVMPDLSGDGFESAKVTIPGRIHIAGESATAEYTASYETDGFVSGSSFSIDGIFNTSGFKGSIDASGSKFVAKCGAARLLGYEADADTVVASVTLKAKDGTVRKSWSVKGNGYFIDAGSGNEDGAFDVEIGDTVDIHFVNKDKVRFYGADGKRQEENAMTSTTQTYKVTCGGFVRADRDVAKPYDAYAAAKIAELKARIPDSSLGNRFVGSMLKAEASRLYSLMNAGENQEIDAWIEKVRRGGTPTVSGGKIELPVSPDAGIDTESIASKIGSLDDAEDGKFKAAVANTTVYIDGKPLSGIDWKAYAGKAVDGTAYVADTDGNTAEVAITLNVGKAKQDGNGNGNGNGTSDSGNGGNGNAQGSPSDGANDGTQGGGNATGGGSKSGDDTLNPSGWKMPKNPRKRNALVQMGVAGGIEAIAVIGIGSVMLIASIIRKRNNR